jgi:signal transduction histidine kinase
LENMKARLTQIGGTFECVSNEGGGTFVSFRLPLPESFEEMADPNSHAN